MRDTRRVIVPRDYLIGIVGSTYLGNELLFICKELMELAAHKCRLFMQKEKWLKYIFSFVIVTKVLSFTSSLFQAKLKCWQEIA